VKRSPLQRKTGLKRGAPLARSRMRRKARRQPTYSLWPMSCPPGFHEQMMRRAGHTCERCKSRYWLTLSHRLPASKGGPFTDWNIAVLCEGCHGRWVELHPDAAEREGWRVPGLISRGVYHGGDEAYAALVIAAGGGWQRARKDAA
jgi:5-methylcytosine-specific restriction endonuclease McrA